MDSLIPFMSLRGSTLFPENETVLEIGREFTIQSIRRSVSFYNKKIVVASQRAVEMNDQPDLKQVFKVGCLCQIDQAIAFPDGQMKVSIVPLQRFQITELKDDDGTRFCRGKILPKYSETDVISSDQKQRIRQAIEKAFAGRGTAWLTKFLERLKSEERPFEFVMGAAHLVGLSEASTKELTLEQLNQGLFLFDTYTPEEKASINGTVARVQEILEAQDSKIALRKIEALLA